MFNKLSRNKNKIASCMNRRGFILQTPKMYSFVVYLVINTLIQNLRHMTHWYEIFNDELRASNSNFFMLIFAGRWYFSCRDYYY
jgi:hypothetical protein